MKRAFHARAVVVGLLFGTLAPVVTGAQSPSPSTSAASATAGGPLWLQPAIELVKYVVGRFKPSKDEKQALSGKAEAMETDAKNLEPIPKFLAASRDFRKEAVSFASALNIGGANEKAAEAVWSEIAPSLDRVTKAFQESYGDESAKSLTWTEYELQPAQDKCRAALADIKGTLGRASNASAAKDKLDAMRDASHLVNDVTAAAQLPEYWIAWRSLQLIQAYKKLAAETKGSQKTTAVNSIDDTGHPRRWAVIPAAYQEPAPQLPSVAPRSNADESAPDFLRRFRADVVAPVTPEPWTQALASKADGGFPVTPAVIAFLSLTGLVGERFRVASVARRLERLHASAQQQLELRAAVPELAQQQFELRAAAPELESIVKRLRWPLR